MMMMIVAIETSHWWLSCSVVETRQSAQLSTLMPSNLNEKGPIASSEALKWSGGGQWTNNGSRKKHSLGQHFFTYVKLNTSKLFKFISLPSVSELARVQRICHRKFNSRERPFGGAKTRALSLILAKLTLIYVIKNHHTNLLIFASNARPMW